MPSPEPSSPGPPADTTAPHSSKAQRVLACVLCQQRKVKCDRKFPCANCTKVNAQCVPASALAPRQRRRRFAERELLDRLRRYEGLLRQHNIGFDPLHKGSPGREEIASSTDARGGHGSAGEQQPGASAGADTASSPATTTSRSESVFKPKSLWHAMNQRSQASDDDSSDYSQVDLQENSITEAWSQWSQTHNHVLFGSYNADIDVSTLHPEQLHIFKLWQVYLDNVNPLLKVTHTPTLQARIIDAASNAAGIAPNLTALMFGIYCVAVLSLDDGECLAMLGSPKASLLQKYQFSCEQALFRCEFLRSRDRDCLTALYLYLVTARSTTDPHALSSMLGVAIRVAQQMGLHSESANVKLPPFEAEMRRRLWWSLVVFDSRASELAEYTTMMLIPTWDCRTPLDVNDFDLQPDMKEPPTAQSKSTEAVFAVVRSEMADSVRHSPIFLDFINPVLKAIVTDSDGNSDTVGFDTLGKRMEDKYLKFCSPENPIHFMTIWSAREHLAKNSLIEHFSTVTKQSTQPTDAQRDAATALALTMLECDTKLMSSSLTKRYTWHLLFHFPFPAYIQICQDLRKRPGRSHAEQAWEALSDNFALRCYRPGQKQDGFFKIVANLVLQAWEAHEAGLDQSQPHQALPRVISVIRQTTAQTGQDAQDPNLGNPTDDLAMTIDDISMSMPMDFDGQGMLTGMGGLGYAEPQGYPHMSEEFLMEMRRIRLHWLQTNRNMMQWQGW